MSRRKRWGIAATLLAFSAAGLAVAQTATAPAGEGKRHTRKTQAAAPASVGQRVFVDPATGRLAEPTPEQIQALEKAVAEMLSQSSEDLVVIELPDGTLTIDLEGRFQEVAIATKGPDGSIQTGCVNHPGQVKWVLKRKPAPAATALEVK
jgi:hypothetical protein